MEQRWNYVVRGKPHYVEKKLPNCNFLYHKTHIDCPGRKPGLRCEKSDTSCANGSIVVGSVVSDSQGAKYEVKDLLGFWSL
jgi:hypothetical protein